MWSFGQPNAGKAIRIDDNGNMYDRFPIRTTVIHKGDNLVDLLREQVLPYVIPGDIIVMSEKAVAITEGRSFPLDEIKPRPLAVWLSRYVYKTPAGIGIGSPWTMEFALREAGTWRILLAAVVSVIGKLFGIRGLFYRVAGSRVAAIDGPTPYTLPPYNKAVNLGPRYPQRTAQQVADQLGVPFVIIDANDLGRKVLGASAGVDRKLIERVFRDNPLGQGSEQTPVAIVRPVPAQMTQAATQ